MQVDTAKLLNTLLGRKAELDGVGKTITITADFVSVRRGAAVHLKSPSAASSSPIPSLMKAVARAHCWYERITAGERVSDIAQRSGLSTTYVNRILQLAILSPQITSNLLSGEHRANLTLETLARELPLDWREQDRWIA